MSDQADEAQQVQGEPPANPPRRDVTEIALEIENLAIVAHEDLAAIRRKLDADTTVSLAPLVSHDPGKSVREKVYDLMRAVTMIEKSKTAPKEMGGFKYRGIDDTMAVIGSTMRSVGLIFRSTVEKIEYRTHETSSKVRTSCMLVMRYEFVDNKTGESFSFEAPGEGCDHGDRATSKAMASALKYGLLHALMIPVEAMPDPDGESGHVEPERPQETSAARTPEQPVQSKPERALAAAKALTDLSSLPLEAAKARWLSIRNHALSENILGEMVGTATVKSLLESTWHTMATPPPAADDQAPY